MDAVLQDDKFSDFGADSLFPFQRTGLISIESSEPGHLRDQVRKFAPREPGVYGMLDPMGRLIYVGKSKCLRNRLLSYFLPNNEEDKAGRIVQTTQAIVWELQPSEFAALVREQSLIRQFQPRFNVQGIPKRQQPIYVCLGRRPAEQLYTARYPDPKAIYVIGPLAGATRANRAVEVLNRIFKLRDCSSKQACSFTDQLQLFDIGLRPGCIRLELETCLGPCISACSRKDYDQQVVRSRRFMSGESDEPINVIQSQMERASANHHFEQAAVLREDLRSISWLHRRTVDLATARTNYTFVYPVAADPHSSVQVQTRVKQEVWYLIRKGMIEGSVAAPRNRTETRRTNALLRNWLASNNCLGANFSQRPETLALVTSWFRKHRSELKKTFLPHRISRAKTSAANVPGVPGQNDSTSKNPYCRSASNAKSSVRNAKQKIVKV